MQRFQLCIIRRQKRYLAPEQHPLKEGYLQNIMNKAKVFFAEHLREILIAAIVLVAVVFVIVIFTIASSGNTERKPIITEVTGNAFILKDDGQISANKRMIPESGEDRKSVV